RIPALLARRDQRRAVDGLGVQGLLLLSDREQALVLLEPNSVLFCKGAFGGLQVVSAVGLGGVIGRELLQQFVGAFVDVELIVAELQFLLAFLHQPLVRFRLFAQRLGLLARHLGRRRGGRALLLGLLLVGAAGRDLSGVLPALIEQISDPIAVKVPR